MLYFGKKASPLEVHQDYVNYASYVHFEMNSISLQR